MTESLGYGYTVPDEVAIEKLPLEDGLWEVDLHSKKEELLVSVPAPALSKSSPQSPSPLLCTGVRFGFGAYVWGASLFIQNCCDG